MNETITKIFQLFEGLRVLSILESKQNYIVSVCAEDVPVDTATGSLYAVDKTTFKVSEFSYFSKPDEYAEACDNVVYKYDEANDDELAHYGILGMKWGVRRYQNKDGSLTSAGKKRQQKLRDEIKKIPKRKATKEQLARRAKLEKKLKQLDDIEDAYNNRPKKIHEMSDDELVNYIARRTAEKNAYILDRDIAAMNPKSVSAGKKFAADLRDKVLGPAVMESGKKLMTNMLNQAVEKATGQKLSAHEQLINQLKKEADVSNLKKQIAENKNAIKRAESGQKEESWDDKLKRLQYEDAMEKRAQKNSGATNTNQQPVNQPSQQPVNQPSQQPVKQAKQPEQKKIEQTAKQVDTVVNDSKWSNTTVSEAAKQTPVSVKKASNKVIEDNFDKEWDYYYKYLEDQYWAGRDD